MPLYTVRLATAGVKTTSESTVKTMSESRVLWTRHITNTHLLILIMRSKSSSHYVPHNIRFCNSQNLYLVIVSDSCSLLSTMNGVRLIWNADGTTNITVIFELWTLNPRDDQDNNTETWAYLDTMFCFSDDDKDAFQCNHHRGGVFVYSMGVEYW